MKLIRSQEDPDTFKVVFDKEDVEAIALRTSELIQYGQDKRCRVNEAMKILNVSRSRLSQILAEYPELKVGGKSSHFYDRDRLMKLQAMRTGR